MSTEKTKFTCPDCAGAIEKITEGSVVQYRCRVGHQYSPETALVVHSEREENTLWSAVVVLEEGADLAEEIARMDDCKAPADLAAAAKAKRALAQRIREVVLEFPKILPLDIKL